VKVAVRVAVAGLDEELEAGAVEREVGAVERFDEHCSAGAVLRVPAVGLAAGIVEEGEEADDVEARARLGGQALADARDAGPVGDAVDAVPVEGEAVAEVGEEGAGKLHRPFLGLPAVGQ